MTPLKWLLTFLLLAVVARWGSFFPSVINHDESTYIVIADELLRGQVYLRDVVDTKPIGIFWLYALFLKLTGGSLFLLRVIAALVVGAGAFGLYLTGRRAFREERVGVAAGAIYVIITSVFRYYGVSPNTEIYFNGLTIAAVALAVAPRFRRGEADPFWHWPAAGLLLGLAMIIKPFAAAEALAIGLFMLWYYWGRGSYGRGVAAGLALTGAFALPLLFVYGYYAQLGLLEELAFYTFTVGAAYPVDLPWYLRLKYMADYVLLRCLPFVLLWVGALGLWAKKGARAQVQKKDVHSRVRRRWLRYFALQFLLVTVVVLLTGKRFGHYQVQLAPVIALLAATWWAPGLRSYAFLRGPRLRRFAPWLVGTVCLALGFVHYFYYAGKADDPRTLATYFADKLEPEETVFLVNGWQITYHLLDRPVPTPYVHSSLLFLDHHVRAFRIDEEREARRILEDERVRYLVTRKRDAELDGKLGRALLGAFAPVDTVAGKFVVYRR